MISIKQIVRPLSIALIITTGIITGAVKLSSLNYKSASVLPYYYHNETKWVILPQEAFGRDKGTVDDLGGSRDKGEKHPVVTAAREFYEEAIIKQTIGLTLQQTIRFLNKNSKYIIGYSNTKGSCNITYIVNFDQYKDMFFNNFYKARHNAPSHKYKEKDKIVVVKWQDLKDVFTQQETGFFRSWFKRFFNQNVTVAALEQDPSTLTFCPTTVTLRPFLVKKLRPFFLDKPYQQGMNKKIRLYSE